MEHLVCTQSYEPGRYRSTGNPASSLTQIGRRRNRHGGWITKVKGDLMNCSKHQGDIEVHIQSQSALSNGTAFYALKCLKNPGEFETEKTLLSACNGRNHDHIVELVASCTWQGLTCLLLPVAENDLQEYWKHVYTSESNAGKVEALRAWAFQQMVGLTSAVCTIHNNLWIDGKQRACLHGDIQASNILVHGAHDSIASPTLKLADFASSAVDLGTSRSPRFPRGYIVGTYQPPECLLELERSLACDIWGLGCLFLEFIVWLRCGFSGLEHFAELREQTDYGFGFAFINDYFFELCSGEEVDISHEGRIKRTNGAVSRYLRELRHATGRSGVNAVLTTVQEDMLLVDPGARISADELNWKLQDILK